MIAAGRAPDVEGLGLEEAGMERDERGLIKVDGRLRTSREGVWAIGDMVPGPALAHKASDEGIIAVEDAAGNDVHPIDYSFIPAVTFCHPQVASFGLTEKEAREAGYDVVVGKVPMGAVGAPTVYGDRGGLVKIVGDAKYGEILGGHIVLGEGRRPDPGAGERPRARGRLRRGGPDHPPAPRLRRDGDGGRAGDGRLADPRLRLPALGAPQRFPKPPSCFVRHTGANPGQCAWPHTKFPLFAKPGGVALRSLGSTLAAPAAAPPAVGPKGTNSPPLD